MTNGPRRIEIGTSALRGAFVTGLEYFQPTYGGHDLFVEAGITQYSLDNLAKIVEHIGPPVEISVGKKQGIWVEFDGSDTYFATGFSIGYRGEGPSGLAHFAAEHGFGKFTDLLTQIAELEQDFRGVLFERKT